MGITLPKGHFPPGGIFRVERHFLLFKDQLAETGRQKTEENIIPRRKFRLVEKSPKAWQTCDTIPLHRLSKLHNLMRQKYCLSNTKTVYN